MNTIKKSNFGFLKVAAVSLKLRVADIDYNTSEIIKQFKNATSGGACLVVFPELSLTGYTAAD
ncbi:MAG: nitrilase-related carbon-nitrogen hydrolase, partial [Patescibacteria group bacterium]